VEAIIPDPQFRKRDEQFAGQKGHGEKGRFTAKDFKHDKKRNQYLCPRKKVLAYKGHVELNRNSGEKYQAKSGDCRGCKLQEKCIASRGGEESEEDIVYSRQNERRESIREDEEEDRRDKIPSIVREADADNRAVFCGHKLL
jgi:hypothetical protein